MIRIWFCLLMGCFSLLSLFTLVQWALSQPVDALAAQDPSAHPFSGVLTKELHARYRDSSVDSISIKSCRIRSQKGNRANPRPSRILEIEDLRLNVPLPSASATSTNAQTHGGRRNALERGSDPTEDPLSWLIGRIGFADLGRFSGVTLKGGLQVGRLTATGAKPLFNAQKIAPNGDYRLCLDGCTVFLNGEPVSVGKAYLEMEDCPRLVWSGGHLDIPDFLEEGR